MNEKSQGLWANIHAKRRRGERMRKKGEKGAPTPDAIKSAQNEMMTTADAGIPHDTKGMGPRFKTTVMHDRRRKKDAMPVLLKRFRKYIEDQNIGK